jgi:hypothetical protein
MLKKNKKPRKYSNAAVRQQVLRGRRKFHKRTPAGDENQSSQQLKTEVM